MRGVSFAANEKYCNITIFLLSAPYFIITSGSNTQRKKTITVNLNLDLGEILSKRSHFNAAERALLLDLIDVYKRVLENKRAGKM